MRRRSPLSLDRIIERMAAFSAPRHRDLVRAMVSELQSIADPAERKRFAVGAIAAIVRLALSRYSGTIVHPGRFLGIPEPEDNANLGGPSMPKLSTQQLLSRHVTPFAVAFALLTALQLANFAARQLPQLSARGVSAGTLLEALLLAMPFTMALTIPMAVFLAVSWVFTRLGVEGVLAAAQRERHGVRRLIGPVLGAAAVIAALTFVSNTQILPRTNARLAAVLADTPVERTDRSMTLGELREAARNALTDAGPDAAALAVAYEVEIQKKFALAAACLVLALAGATIALRFPRGGIGLVIGASGVVFTGYYISLVAGEALADQQLVAPFVAMWMANAILLAIILLLSWRSGGPGGRSMEILAIGG
ncbi:MAG: LptF/LptG family permease [Gemmatimonas sp.]|nr:LptF/LptG family permease [Gemmatimonas sp.]